MVFMAMGVGLSGFAVPKGQSVLVIIFEEDAAFACASHRVEGYFHLPQRKATARSGGQLRQTGDWTMKKERTEKQPKSPQRSKRPDQARGRREASTGLCQWAELKKDQNTEHREA
jgi:hypothetical protein